MIRRISSVLVCLYAVLSAGCGEEPKVTSPGPTRPSPKAEAVPAMPMAAPMANSAAARWRAKKVLKSRLLDDMEDLRPWRLASIADQRELVLTAERAIDGEHSLRFRSPTKGTRPSKDGNPFGSTTVIRAVDGEDWRAWNRMSVRVYPHLPGHHAVSMSVSLINEGRSAGGAGTNYFVLKNGQWNHLVWEFPDVARDRVRGVLFSYTLNGNEAGSAEVAQFDLDHLELQAVEPDAYEGWNVRPGRIVFSHTGYPTGGPKAAIGAALEAKRFELLDAASGQAVLTGPIRTVETRIGRFQELDFTGHQVEGVYRLRAGKVRTRTFRIASAVWRPTLWKAINFFYCQRCGWAVEGIHGVCHGDWRAEHDGRWIVLNGGWHDAGDMSQGLVNTSEATVAMFELYGRLRARGDNGPLARRVLEEARWGLRWVMKTTFHDGYRLQWAEHRFWTNGKLGDVDDVVAQARQDPAGNFYAARAEAVAANALKPVDAASAGEARNAAIEDFRLGCERFDKVARDDLQVEQLGPAALAAIELHRATGKQAYIDRARTWARVLVASQQKKVPPALGPAITGWFHRTARRREPLRYYHRCHEHAPVLALVRLCEALPNDGDWMSWYAAVTRWSQYYQKPMAALTRPYGLLANSVWHVDEHRKRPERERADLKERIENGVDLGGGWHLRAMAGNPRSIYRGNNGTVLTQALALAAAGHLRGDLAAAQLCREQLYWVLGRNPFGQCLLYGEGYDFPPYYSPRSGQIVGALPVGIKHFGNRDLPYWPCTSLCCYKEIWVHPVSRWISLMGELSGEPIVRGRAPGARAVTFRHAGTGRRHTVRPDGRSGRFELALPAGAYEVAGGDVGLSLTLLPGRVRELDLRPGRALDLRIEHRSGDDGQVSIALHAAGTGRHRFELRAENLGISRPARTAELKPGRATTLTWAGKVETPGAPWVGVVVADGDPARRIEATGLAGRPHGAP